MKATLPFPPSGNTYKRHICANDRRHRVIAYLTDAAKRYIAEVAAAVRGCPEPLPGEVAVTVHVYRPRAQGDLDNSLKMTLDHVQGHLYRNDSQVVEIHAYRHEGRGAGRVEVVVEPAAGVVQAMMEAREAEA